MRSTLDFRTLFESVPGLFLVVLPDDPEFTMVAASEAFVRAVKKPREMLLDRGLFDVFPSGPEASQAPTLPNLRESFRRVLATRLPDTMPVQQYDLPRAESEGGGLEEHYWSPLNSPILATDGSVGFIVHRVEDVTEFVLLKRAETEHGRLAEAERMRAERVEAELFLRSLELAQVKQLTEERDLAAKEMRESEARFRLAFAEAPIGMALKTPYGKITEVNQTYLDMLGYSREELALRDSAHFTHPDDIGLTRQFFTSLREGATTRATMEKRYIGKDGGLLWARASATMRHDEHGRPVQVIAIIEDITERKHAEEELRKSEERLTFALEAGGGMGAWDFDIVHDRLYCNNRFAELFSVDAQRAAAGAPPSVFLDAVHPDDRARIAEKGKQAIETGGDYAEEYRIIQRDGSARWLHARGRGHLNEAGVPVRFPGVVFDVTERKRMELRDAFLVKLDDATRPLTDPNAITLTAARLLGEHLQVDNVAYCNFEPDEETFNIMGDYTSSGVPSMVGRYTLETYGPALSECLRANLPYIVEDTESDPRTAAVSAAYRSIGIRASVAAPLYKAGRLVGAMGAHHQMPRRWQPEEVELLQQVANRCWESIERARIAGALQASETRLRVAQRAGRIGSFEWVLKEGKVIWTPELEVLFGLPEGTFEGTVEDWLKRMAPEDAARVWANIQDCLARQQEECVFEFRAVLPEGKRRWLRGQAQIFYNEGGEPSQMVGVNIDVDDQKQAEALLRQQWHTFDTALSHTPDFTYIFDLEGRFVYMNRALLSLWQKSYEDAVGSNFFDLGYPPELAGRLQDQIQQVIDTKEPLRDQNPFTDPTGETRYYEYIFVPVFAPDGQIEAVAGSTRDITELRKTDAERERLLAEAAASNRELLTVNRELEEFAFVASHDLQEPLRMVNSYSQLLLRRHIDPDDAVAREYSDFIQKGVRRMEQLISDLLSYSRVLHRGELLLTESLTADLNASWAEALTVMGRRISESGAEITAGPLPTVRGDTAQLAHVFQNLLSNAIKYRQEKHAPRVEINAERRNGMWVVAFRDKGIGFEQKYAQGIFGLFKRLHRDEYPGTGLGLAICQRIVERYQGRIWAESKPGVGSTFFIALPAVEAGMSSAKGGSECIQ